MNFFLMILFFTPFVLADDVRRDTEETADQQIPPVCIFISEDVCVATRRDIERVMGQGAVAHIMEEAEEMAAQRAQVVRDAIDNLRLVDVNPELQRMDITPELRRTDIIPKLRWIKPTSQKAQMEMYHDMSVLGKHLSGLIAGSDGALCNLSQDPLQCCNTFAQSPDQCLVEKIEKGLLDPSALTEGVCDVAQNMEQCASQAKPSVLLRLATQKAKWGS